MNKYIYNSPIIKSTYYNKDDIKDIINASKKETPDLNFLSKEKPSGKVYLSNKQNQVNTCQNLNYIKDCVAPYNMIFKLMYRKKDGNGNEYIETEATGFFIDSRVIATVAHSQKDRNNDWYDSVIIVPCVKTENGKCIYPLGGVVSCSFGMTNNSQNDHAVIFLSDAKLYQQIKNVFELKNLPKGKTDASMAGYTNSSCRNTKSFHLEYGSGEVIVNDFDLKHNFESEKGQSGMPIWIEENNAYSAIGINDTACGLDKIKLTHEIINDFNYWINI